MNEEYLIWKLSGIVSITDSTEKYYIIKYIFREGIAVAPTHDNKLPQNKRRYERVVILRKDLNITYGDYTLNKSKNGKFRVMSLKTTLIEIDLLREKRYNEVKYFKYMGN